MLKFVIDHLRGVNHVRSNLPRERSRHLKVATTSLTLVEAIGNVFSDCNYLAIHLDANWRWFRRIYTDEKSAFIHPNPCSFASDGVVAVQSSCYFT